ncbi:MULTISPECIES: imm11 family protein [unclassified Crossiella]|uniref:imm11 family protein n=1 Tax=unclassified Crossiella TaxID=2620835 RepID=UPI001FFF6BE5|nr:MULTISPECIES: DUF1629 domain-containing protein [unclassified Crossiella]MCK2238967.1 hypothetical protein [Crossiella sp. S99.2]MCK2251464.1 hypothetical protein [Crossiella sp. S99.1]
MRIFVAAPRTDFEWAMPVHEDDHERLRLEAVPLANAWEPVDMEPVREKGDGPSDFPWYMSLTLLLKDRAIDVLAPLLAEFGELLPARFPDARLALLNVLNVVDALDEEASEIIRFQSSGRIMRIETPVFRPELVPPRSVFKIPQMPAGEIFYTEEIVREFEKSGFAGLWFKALWDTEHGSYGRRLDEQILQVDRSL